MKRIGIVTVGRSDYGIYRPLLDAMKREPGLESSLLVGGMHLSDRFGHTVDQIEEDGFEIVGRVAHLVDDDSPHGIAESIGRGVLGFARAFEEWRPDLLIALGDRFEMYSAVVAAVPFLIPVAHIHGGELTEGAIDDGLRHSMTKLSHLHFVATEEFGARVRQMGEAPERVFVTGALGVDALKRVRLLDREELERRFRVPPEGDFVLVTYHPETRRYDDSLEQIDELIAALDEVGHPALFTLPNADTGGRVIRERILHAVDRRGHWLAVENMGTEGYASAMAEAAVMVGNSSSGLIEAPSFGLPVVNVGDRQRGRLQPANVISTECKRREIRAAIEKATGPSFRQSVAVLPNPYGDGHAAERIIAILLEQSLDRTLIKKKFCDLVP